MNLMSFRSFQLAATLPLALSASLVAQTPRPALESVLRSERYVAPPDPIASAVLAPRHQNITLAEPSPDRQWFLQERGDALCLAVGVLAFGDGPIQGLLDRFGRVEVRLPDAQVDRSVILAARSKTLRIPEASIRRIRSAIHFCKTAMQKSSSSKI